MNARILPGMVMIALLALSTPCPAQFCDARLLLDAPTTDVLPAGSLAFSARVTGPLVNTSSNYQSWEADVNVRFSPVNRLGLALTAYTLKDYVLDASYRLLGGDANRFALAIGVCDLGLNGYVSPVGSDTTHGWPDWQYRDQGKLVRTTENPSPFVVTSIPLTKLARAHVGLGRGRFVGYDARSKYFNTDIFFKEKNQWAVALFGGLELHVLPNVALVAEANSRDGNIGAKANFGPVTGTIAWQKVEGLLFSKGDARFGRIALGVSYQLDKLPKPGKLPERREPPCVPVEPVPPPEPAPAVEEGRLPAQLQLEPIYFAWDKWEITSEAAALLHKNAEVLKSNPSVKVMIVGRASEEGPDEHNVPLSERRAKATYEHLKSLGVPADQMEYQGLGERPGKPFPPHRTAYFEIKQR